MPLDFVRTTCLCFFFFLIGKGILIEGVLVGTEREKSGLFLNEVLILEGRGSLSSDL